MIEIIPAIDIIGGKCVRLTQGNYDCQKTYSENPVEVAKQFEGIGIRRLHVVDLDGAKNAAPVNLSTLKKIAEQTSLDIEFGGGIKNEAAVSAAFENGANRVICGSIAVEEPDNFCAWIEKFGSRKIILGADVRNGFIATHGWLKNTQIKIEDLIERFVPCGLLQVVCTDISRDGMLGGVSENLYTTLQTRFPQVDITVSGGISSIADISKLNALGLRAVIVGKAFYEGKITLKELSEYSD